MSSNADNHASQQASQAANQATASENKLNAQQMAIVQQMLQEYNQQAVPLEGGASSAESGLLGAGSQAGSTADSYINSLLNPTSTGVDTNALANNALGYLGNTSGTNLTGATATAQGGNATAAGADTSALGYYLNQMQNGGISPDLIANALGQNEAGTQQQLNSLRNSLGGRGNIGSLTNDAMLSGQQNQASLLAQLTGQSQDLRNNAASGATTAGNALLGAGQTSTQEASGLDSQTMQMLMQAYGLGNTQQQTTLGNDANAASASTSALQNVLNYINQSRAGVTGEQSVISGLSNQAGNAASGAAAQANTDSQAAAANNPFSSLGSIASSYLASKNATPATPAPTTPVTPLQYQF